MRSMQDSAAAASPGGSPEFRWRRDLQTSQGRLGPLVLEEVDLRLEAGSRDGPLLVGSLRVLAGSTQAIGDGTLHLVARDAAGLPLSTDWEALPALQPGQQAELAVQWRLEPGQWPASVGLSLAVLTASRCRGRADLRGGGAAEQPARCGLVELLGLRVSIDEPDEDGDIPVQWLAEVHNPGPPLTEVELSLELGATADAHPVLTAPAVLSGHQVLRFTTWLDEPPPAFLPWVLTLGTPQLYGPFNLPSAPPAPPQ